MKGILSNLQDNKVLNSLSLLIWFSKQLEDELLWLDNNQGVPLYIEDVPEVFSFSRSEVLLVLLHSTQDAAAWMFSSLFE